ncbi:MAG: histidine kinase [Bacteroidetes bacterium]|nr:MAG: histidine kinase [Bacteroidota bacterium]
MPEYTRAAGIYYLYIQTSHNMELFKKIVRDFILIASIGGMIGLFLFANPITVYERGGLSLLWAYIWRGGVGTAVLWLGNAYLSAVPDRWYTWTAAPVKRLVAATVLTIVFTCVAWVFMEWLFSLERYGSDFGRLVRELTINDFIIPLVITFLISIFMHGRGFLYGWKETLIEAERLKKEHISARYETLKSQINPHFLFNSLNVLTSLVHKDADQAEQFIRRLSTVYRYILESRDQEVVPLEEELSILRAYLFLMDTRFGASLKVDIRIPDDIRGQIAPLTLQMLVENALKHNEASKARPLQVEIYQENGYLVVENTLQPKNTLPESTGLGLANIQARYQVLTQKPVRIQPSDTAFVVKIPVL